MKDDEYFSFLRYTHRKKEAFPRLVVVPFAAIAYGEISP